MERADGFIARDHREFRLVKNECIHEVAGKASLSKRRECRHDYFEAEKIRRIMKNFCAIKTIRRRLAH
jgi:hypothetical protein